jgi:diacylglycerol kinase (ATP)
MTRIGVLNNLRSGRGQSRVEQVLALLRSHPDVLHVETGNSSLMPEALAEFEREGVELLVVNGGDGTLQHLLTELLSAREGTWLPRVAPIRGGRTNVSAIDLGADRDPVRSLSTLIDAARAGRLREREVDRAVLRVDLGPGDGVHYGIFFGAGMLYRAVQLTPRYFPEGRAQGLFGAGTVFATLLGRAAAGRLGGVLGADKVQLSVDGEPGPAREYRLVMATSAERLFLGIRPFWGEGPGPVRLTLLAADARHLSRAALGILRGRPKPWVGPELGYESYNSECVELRLDCGVTLDGELFAEQPGRVVELRGDRRIRFVRG